MADTTKLLSERDANQVLQHVHNNVNATLSVDGFVVGKVGRKVVRSVVSPTVDDYEFYDSATLLYTLRVTYSDASHTDVNQVERTV